MKSKIFTLIGICFLFLSCNNELLEIQEEGQNQDLNFSMSSNALSSSLPQEYEVIDADNCDPNGQYISNFWWPLTETSFTSGFFGTTDDHKLKFTEYEDGTAHLAGTTSALVGGCIVTIDLWLKDKKDWQAWSAGGGLFKDESADGACAGAVGENLNYYTMDTEKSTITSAGSDCIDEGVYGIEQRPEGDYGVQVGPGAAAYDSNVGANGLATWGWIVDKHTRARLWILDFNLLLEPKEEPCSDCEGKVTDLELEFDWHYAKRVKIYQRSQTTGCGVKIFDKVLQPGEKFTINGANRDGSIGRYAYIYINHCYYTKIKTNCYIKIGPGYTKGVFNVISGNSSEGGELCEYVKPDYNKCYRHWSCRYYSKCRYGY